MLSGKTAVAGAPGAIPETARVFHSMSIADLDWPTSDIWPPEVEHLGLRFSATVRDATSLYRPPSYLTSSQQQRCRSRCEVLRQADALLAVSDETAEKLVDHVHVRSDAVTVVGAGEPWEEVVTRAAAVLEELAVSRRHSWSSPVRVAFVSPFPPISSGVAAYSARLVEAMSRELEVASPGASIDCFADGLDRVRGDSLAPVATGDCRNAGRFVATERALGGYDRVVYVVGNSEFHHSALAALGRRRGTVMAHDVRMTGLLRLSMDRRHPFAPALAAGVARLASEGSDDGDADGQPDVEGLGSLLLAEVASHADQLLVSSEAARRLAEGQVGPELAGRIRALPFAMALDGAELEIVAAARSQQADALPLLVSFGIVDPSKLPHLLLEATSALRPDVDVRLAFVGPVSDALALELRERAAQLGIADRVRVTGQLDRSEYLGYLGRATAAVELRAGFSGEASAAVSDALAAGVATVVSDMGWMGGLPAETVVKVDTSGEGAGERLAAALRSLLGDPSRRASLSTRAADYAATQTFERAAAALVSALDLGREG